MYFNPLTPRGVRQQNRIKLQHVALFILRKNPLVKDIFTLPRSRKGNQFFENGVRTSRGKRVCLRFAPLYHQRFFRRVGLFCADMDDLVFVMIAKQIKPKTVAFQFDQLFQAVPQFAVLPRLYSTG